MTPPEYPEHEWVRTEWCAHCQTETDMFWVEWRDEPVVTRECLSCGTVVEYADTL